MYNVYIHVYNICTDPHIEAMYILLYYCVLLYKTTFMYSMVFFRAWAGSLGMLSTSTTDSMRPYRRDRRGGSELSLMW